MTVCYNKITIYNKNNNNYNNKHDLIKNKFTTIIPILN